MSEIGASASLQKCRAYEQLLIDIILGLLPPNDKLDERALSARYGLGVAAVRDALGRLALERLVVRRSRQGTLVAPLDMREIQEAFDIRQLLEPQSSAFAAERGSKADHHAICSAFDGAEEAIEARDYRRLIAMDRSFHRSVLQATGNRLLADKLASLQSICSRYWVFVLGHSTPEQAADDVSQHRALGWAIARGDAARAQALSQAILGQTPAPVSRAAAAARAPRAMSD